MTTAIVSGGSRGIGFACAKKLACLGYSVAILGRSQDAVEAAAQRIQKEEENKVGIARGYECDVRRFDEVKTVGESKIHVSFFSPISLFLKCIPVFVFAFVSHLTKNGHN